MKSTDFSPIAEQGELEPQGGLLSRLGRRREIGPVSSGYARILLDAEGRPLDQDSAGQKYWSRARGWVKVDIKPHQLEYQIPFDDPSGLAGLVATVNVSATVSDPQAAAKEGSESVEAILMPLLRDAIRHAHGRAGAPQADPDPVAAINALAVKAEEDLAKLTGKRVKAPQWLDAELTSVTVELDDSSKAHRDELVRAHRGVSVVAAESKKNEAEAEAAATLRATWGESFKDLADPWQRAIARLSADPSAENVDRVMTLLDQAEAHNQAVLLEAFQRVMSEHLVDKEDVPQWAAAISPELVKRIPDGSRSALDQGGRDDDHDDADVIEAEAETVETTENEVEGEGESGEGEGEGHDRKWKG